LGKADQIVYTKQKKHIILLRLCNLYRISIKDLCKVFCVLTNVLKIIKDQIKKLSFKKPEKLLCSSSIFTTHDISFFAYETNTVIVRHVTYPKWTNSTSRTITKIF
jgi:hypothetical protein